RREEDAPRAEPVGHPATDRNEHREAEDVAGHHRLQAERLDLQAGGHHRNGGVDDGRVQRLHEHDDRHHPGQVALGILSHRHHRVQPPSLMAAAIVDAYTTKLTATTKKNAMTGACSSCTHVQPAPATTTRRLILAVSGHAMRPAPCETKSNASPRPNSP